MSVTIKNLFSTITDVYKTIYMFKCIAGSTQLVYSLKDKKVFLFCFFYSKKKCTLNQINWMFSNTKCLYEQNALMNNLQMYL